MRPKVVSRVQRRDQQTAIPSRKPELPKVVVSKNSRRTQDELGPAKAFAALSQFIGLITRIAINIAQLFADGSHAIVQDVMLENFDLPRHENVRVHFLILKPPDVPTKDPCLQNGIKIGSADPSPKNMVLSRQRKRMNLRWRRRSSRENFFLGASLQHLVGVYLKHPLMSALRNSPVLLLRRLDILVLNDARAILAADVKRAVGAERIHHQNFICPLDGLQRRTDYLRVVERRQQNTYL